MMGDLTLLSRVVPGIPGQALLSKFFDGNMRRTAPFFSPVQPGMDIPGQQRAARQGKSSGEPVKYQDDLGIVHLGYPRALQATLNGALYKMVPKNPIYRAVPDSKGFLWNKDGVFVGDWKSATQTTWDHFMAATGKDGRDHLYTVRMGAKDKATAVFRDGRPLANLPSERRHSSLRKVHVGLDDNLYAVYYTKSVDQVYRRDPLTGSLRLVAALPAQRQPGGTIKMEERLEDIEVTRQGRIYTQFKGNVFQELGPSKGRYLVAGSEPGYYPANRKDYPKGDIFGFRIDSYGNLYTDTTEKGIFVNGKPTGTNMAIDMLKIDDQGNIYRMLYRNIGGSSRPILKKSNVLADPASAERSAERDYGP